MSSNQLAFGVLGLACMAAAAGGGYLATRQNSVPAPVAAQTAVYTREYLFVNEMVQNGALGAIQFLRGAHYQDMENWPSYWMGLPPMYYATHAISPLLLPHSSYEWHYLFE